MCHLIRDAISFVRRWDVLGGVAEAFVPGAGAAETAKRVGKVLGAWLLGATGFWFLFGLFFML